MDGGKKLGEGLHGVAYDVNSSDRDSFFNMIKDKNITKIILFTQDDKNHVLNSKEEIDKFVDFLSTVEGKIAKIFKKSIFRTISIEDDLKIEMENNSNVNKIYKPNASKYTTTIGLPGFYKSPVIGGIVEIDNKPLYFTAFGTKCGSINDIDPKRFILDILESLSKLEKKGYSHNDLKLNNIIDCDTHYKLIDWGFLRKKESLENTSAPFTNPLKWYVKGKSAVYSKTFMTYFILPNSSKFKFIRTPIYKKFKERIFKEVDEVVSKYSREQIKERQEGTYDTYMFGCTILEAIETFNLKDPVYLELAYKLTSLIDPINSTQGLKLAKKMLQ